MVCYGTQIKMWCSRLSTWLPMHLALYKPHSISWWAFSFTRLFWLVKELRETVIHLHCSLGPPWLALGTCVALGPETSATD